MICKLNGAVIAAVLGILSVAGGTSASAAEFHSAVHPQTLSGSQTTVEVFTTDSGTITCKKATLSGTTSAKTSTTVTLTPSWGECTAFGFINIPIHVNGCAYVYHSTGTIDLECPLGKKIEWTAPFCTTTYGAQHIAEGMTFHSNAGKTDVIMTVNIIKAIDYNECGSAKANGSTTGTYTITAGSGSVWFE